MWLLIDLTIQWRMHFHHAQNIFFCLTVSSGEKRIILKQNYYILEYGDSMVIISTWLLHRRLFDSDPFSVQGQQGPVALLAYSSRVGYSYLFQKPISFHQFLKPPAQNVFLLKYKPDKLTQIGDFYFTEATAKARSKSKGLKKIILSHTDFN